VRLPETERARFRGQALAWLQADLAAWRQELGRELLKSGVRVRHRMQHWQEDPSFTGVRSAEALSKLPQAEREKWQDLWAEVAQTLVKVGGKSSSGVK
jgi:eukaryotic-like serine/threonine-protein kinase